MFRLWHWYTWRKRENSRELIGSWASGLALIIQKQMSALYIINPWILEDPRGVCINVHTQDFAEHLKKAICGSLATWLCLVLNVLVAFFWQSIEVKSLATVIFLNYQDVMYWKTITEYGMLIVDRKGWGFLEDTGININYGICCATLGILSCNLLYLQLL